MAKKVSFILSAEVVGAATSGLLLGEFNNWNYNDGINLEKQKDGSMKATASLEAGKKYEYRYLLNDGRWVNDQSADHYVHISGLHVENCVINVPAESVEKKQAPAKEIVLKETVKAAPVKKITAKPVAPKTTAIAATKEKIVKEPKEKVSVTKTKTPKAK